MNSSIYYFLYLKLSKLNNVTILGAALFGAQAFQKKSLFQLLSVSILFSQTTSERPLAQRQGIE
jgi:hypothetical protein